MHVLLILCVSANVVKKDCFSKNAINNNIDGIINCSNYFKYSSYIGFSYQHMHSSQLATKFSLIYCFAESAGSSS